MSRSSKKGPYVDERLYRKVEQANAASSTAPIRVYQRSCTIVPEFIGRNFDIHNGRIFVKLFVTEDMVGHKFGEFAPTRNFRTHTTAGKR